MTSEFTDPAGNPIAFYDLDGNPVSMLEWARIASTLQRFVGLDTVGDLVVGTWWSGMDLSHGENPTPLIFETIVWDVNNRDHIFHSFDRTYPTREFARSGHAQTVLMVQHAQEHQ